jgi:hypothetical protein
MTRDGELIGTSNPSKYYRAVASANAPIKFDTSS